MVLLNYFVRSLYVVLWIGIIYGCLLIPRFFVNKSIDQKTLHVYTWANRIDETIIKNFEKQTGIKVYLNYYESSEELLTKLEMISSIDCDIMLPSTFIIDAMIQQGLIKKIDRSKCSFLQRISPEFLGLYFDSNNDYSIPLYWDVFGIGYNQNEIRNKPITLDLLFDKKNIPASYIGMTDDAREAIFLAATYLGYKLGNFLEVELLHMQQLLQAQRQWVGSYSDSQQGYFLASNTFPIVASDREIICRYMQQYDFIKFALLQSGSMLRIDSVVISSTSEKDEAIYLFLNYLFSYDVLLAQAQKFCILPTLQDVFDSLDSKYIGVSGLYPGSDSFNKLVLFQHGLTQKQINDFWIQFKAS